MKVNPRNVAGFLRRAYSMKKTRNVEAVSHLNLQSHWTQDALDLRKHTESRSVGATRVFLEQDTESGRGWPHHVKLQSGWENTRESEGVVGRACLFHESAGWWSVAYKFTVEMKPRHILREKTQWFPCGQRERHINLQSKRRPRAFYMRKHNDFFAVDGPLRRGCILIRKRNRVE